MLKYALLGFLNYQPYTGYDLNAVMETSTSQFWHAKLSQIYTTLKKLESEGLVISEMEAQDDRPDKRIYSITDTGRDDLLAWLNEPITSIDQIKIGLLLKLFFSGAANPENVLMELKLQKSLHEKQLIYYRTASKEIIETATKQGKDGEHHKIYWEATRRFGVLYEEMIVQWLDDTISEIQAQAE